MTIVLADQRSLVDKKTCLQTKKTLIKLMIKRLQYTKWAEWESNPHEVTSLGGF